MRDWGTRVAGWLHLGPFRYERPEGPMPSSDPEGVLLTNVIEAGTSDRDYPRFESATNLSNRVPGIGDTDLGCVVRPDEAHLDG